MRAVVAFLLTLVVAAPLAAQEGANEAFPDGWTARLDYPDRGSMDDVSFRTMGSGYHVTLGPRAIFYNADNSARGEYTAHAMFTQTAKLQHPEAYGVFIGGRGLDGESQRYTYFLVRQDGQYLIKRRTGSETSPIVGWTAHDAVNAIGDADNATNALAIDVGAETVRFLVNDREVHALPRADVDAEGIVGLRVNHRLDMHIADFGIDGAGVAASSDAR